MHTLYEKVKDHGVEFILVNLMERPEKVKDVVAERGYTLPVWLDTTGKAARAYKVWGTPGVYLVNPEGYVVAVGLGRRNWNSAEGLEVLRALAERDQARPQ